MRREHLEVVRQFEEPAIDAVIELLGEMGLCAVSEQIGPADAPREEGIAGEHEPRLGSPRPIGHDEADAVRRMPGRVQHRDPNVAHLVLLAVLQIHVREFDGRGGVDEHRRAGDDRQPPGTRHVVRLHVRLEDVGDAHVLLCGRLDIGLDLVLWIHHSAAGCAPSAEEVAGAAGFGREKLSEDHEVGLLPPIHGAARLVHSYSVELIIANTVFLMDR